MAYLVAICNGKLGICAIKTIGYQRKYLFVLYCFKIFEVAGVLLNVFFHHLEVITFNKDIIRLISGYFLQVDVIGSFFVIDVGNIFEL